MHNIVNIMKETRKRFSLLLIFGLLFSGCATSTLDSRNYKVFKLFYPHGVLKSVWIVRNGELNGMKREYTEEGILSVATYYKDGKIDDMRNLYHPDGSIWQKEIYVDGVLTEIKTFDQAGILINQEDFK